VDTTINSPGTNRNNIRRFQFPLGSIVLVRKSVRLTTYGTLDLLNSLIEVLLNIFCSPVLNCSSSKAKVPPRRNIKVYSLICFSQSKIGNGAINTYICI